VGWLISDSSDLDLSEGDVNVDKDNDDFTSKNGNSAEEEISSDYTLGPGNEKDIGNSTTSLTVRQEDVFDLVLQYRLSLFAHAAFSLLILV
jgi:hypothetical protein